MVTLKILLWLWAGPLCSWGIWVRAPYMKKKESICRTKKIRIWWGSTPRWIGWLTVGCNITWTWTCVIALQITDPVLSSERVSYTKKKESNCHWKKCKIWSSAPKGPDTKTNWLTDRWSQ
jgi:hypothetical protein